MHRQQQCVPIELQSVFLLLFCTEAYLSLLLQLCAPTLLRHLLTSYYNQSEDAGQCGPDSWRQREVAVIITRTVRNHALGSD
ncbi:hypothetical protein NQZ68_016112 [Dissostichus eleginoides]|nr:hypothetical protein NQZ68_016112 [Dissostichus eleginoides]